MRARIAGLANCVAVLTLLGLTGCTGSDSTADLVLMGGSVYTLDWSPPGPDGTPAADAPFSAEEGWRPDATP